MLFINEVYNALNNIRAAKTRSFLALLGVLIGAASVVALLYCGQIATEEAVKPFKAMGINLLGASFSVRDQQAVSPSYQMLTELAYKVDGVKDVAPLSNIYVDLNYAGHDLGHSVQLAAVGSQFFTLTKATARYGRDLSAFDGARSYCVVGSAVAKKMQKYGEYQPIGKFIGLGGYTCKVIGVLPVQEANWFIPFDVNKTVLLNFKGAKAIFPDLKINSALFRIEVDKQPKLIKDRLAQQIKLLLPKYHVFINSPQQVVDSIKTQIKVMTTLLEVIGYIALTVGGIGIMNVMLVTVAERHPEIGLRMAVGAKPGDIRLMFVIEAVVLSLLGGGLGTLGGLLITYGTCHLKHWAFTLQILPLLTGFIVSILVGLFFGIYPAYKASKLSPIECLRYS